MPGKEGADDQYDHDEHCGQQTEPEKQPKQFYHDQPPNGDLWDALGRTAWPRSEGSDSEHNAASHLSLRRGEAHRHPWRPRNQHPSATDSTRIGEDGEWDGSPTGKSQREAELLEALGARLSNAQIAGSCTSPAARSQAMSLRR